MSHDPAALLQQRIDSIKAQIAALGPPRPGTLTRQYSVCGTPGCRCKDHPDQRHGPYSQLSYTWQGRSRTEFVRKPEVARVQEQPRNYARLRNLVKRWVDAPPSSWRAWSVRNCVLHRGNSPQKPRLFRKARKI